jgi:hypothetical protein
MALEGLQTSILRAERAVAEAKAVAAATHSHTINRPLRPDEVASLWLVVNTLAEVVRIINEIVPVSEADAVRAAFGEYQEVHV